MVLAGLRSAQGLSCSDPTKYRAIPTDQDQVFPWKHFLFDEIFLRNLAWITSQGNATIYKYIVQIRPL